MTTSPSKPPPKQATKSPTRPKAKAINQLFNRKLEGEKKNRSVLNNSRKLKVQTSLKDSVKIKKEQLQNLGHVTPEKKDVSNPRLIINEQTVLLMLANKSKEEINTLETEEMKKMLTCYRKARAVGTTRGITKMSRVTLMQELSETMDAERSGEFNYININKKSVGETSMEEVGTKAGKTASIPYDATEMDIIYLSNMDLLTYLHYKKISFGEKSDFKKSKTMTRDQIVPLVQKYAAIFDPDIKMEDTQNFLLTTNPDDWDDLPINQLQQHAINWYKFSKAPKNIMETNPEYIQAELTLAQTKLLKDPSLKMETGKIKTNQEFVKVKTTVDMEVDNPAKELAEEEKNMEVDDPSDNPKIEPKVPILDKDLKNNDINNMTRDTAELVYSNYLRLKGYDDDAEQIVGQSEGNLKNDIILVRDELFRRSKKLPVVMENITQSTIDLMPDVPNIDKNLVDDDIDTMTNEELAKTLYKGLKKKGYTQRISTYLQWSQESLRRAIKSQRKENTTKTIKSALKPSLKNGKRSSTSQSSLTGDIVNTWRYSLGYDLPVDKKGTSGLREYLLYIFQEMKSYEKGSCLLLWDTEDTLNAIKNPEDLPKTITQLKKYFNNARPMNNGGRGYVKVRIGLPVTADRPTFEQIFKNGLKVKTCASMSAQSNTIIPVRVDG